MLKYRYPGIRPFTTDEKEIFFGRDNDIANLCRLIDVENHVVLYGKSGYGKSSLLNAGIIPFFSNKEKYRVIYIRFGSYLNEYPSRPLDTLKKILADDSIPKGYFFGKVLEPEEIETNFLWYLLKSIHFASNQNTSYILIFDQFEELFQYPDDQIDELASELSDLLNIGIPMQLRVLLKEKLMEDSHFLTSEETELLRKPLNVKMIFAIRSDSLSLLNRLSGSLPNIQKKYYELNPLSLPEALDAIQEPTFILAESLISPHFSYSNEALNKIIEFLTKGGKNSVETFILQLVCQYIETKVINDKLSIIESENIGDLEEISGNYYYSIISQFPISEQIGIKSFIEDKLMVSGKRVSLDEAICGQSVSDKILNELYHHRLIRKEKNSVGSFSYEISHDSLLHSIRKSREIRLEEERIKCIKTNEYLELLKQKEAEAKKRKRLIIVSVFFLVIIAALTALSIKFSEESAEKERQAAEIKQKKSELDKMTSIVYYNTIIDFLEKGNLSHANEFVKMIFSRRINNTETSFKFLNIKDSVLYKSIENLVFGNFQPEDTVVLKKRIEDYKLTYINLDKAEELLKSGEKHYYESFSLYKELLKKDTNNKFLAEKVKTIDLEIKFRVKNYLNSARIYYNAGGYKDAARETRKALALDPRDKKANSLLKMINEKKEVDLKKNKEESLNSNNEGNIK